jgi:hypothetical protein
MFRKLFYLCVLAGIGWYCQKSGILYNLTNDMQPEPGRECHIQGPVRAGVYVAGVKETMQFVIDSHIGNANEKAMARASLNTLERRGELTTVDDGTAVTVIGNSKLKVLGFPYPLTQIEINSGSNAGSKGWVQREDVVDTPIQELYQNLRVAKPTAKPASGE